MTTTWSTTDKTAGITVSGGGLIATSAVSPAADACIRAVNSASTGKIYIEHVYTAKGANLGWWQVGWANAAFVLNTFLGDDSNSISYSPDDGDVYYNTNPIGTLGTCAPGTIISMAVDFGANRLWMRLNAGNWNNSGTADPATNVGGWSISSITKPIFPASELGQTSDVITSRFSPASWTETVPAGFTEINPPQPPRFVLASIIG